MGFFRKNKEIDIDGYIIDQNSGELLKVPMGQTIYEIPSEVKGISMATLNSMKPSATEIDFSSNKNITSLPHGAFSGFSKLLKVVLPPNLKKMGLYFGTDSFNRGIEIVLPNHLEQFAQNQFSPYLTKLELEDTITSVNRGIVSHNNILEELIVPGEIKRLDSLCINQTKYLEKVWLKEGIMNMAPNSIRGCSNLREIHIPSSLKSFYLGPDDYRSVKGYSFNEKNYHPSPEQVEKEKNRIIKLYKMVNGKEVLFEVNRNSFDALSETPTELLFSGYGHTYRIGKEEIENCKHIVVDIVNKKMYDQSKIETIPSPSFSVPNREVEKAENDSFNLDHIHISKNLSDTNLSKKSIIENLLKYPISRVKKIRNPYTNAWDTVLKTQRELSDEKISLLEDLEEDYMGRIDNKTYLTYERYLNEVYATLIASAPYEKELSDPFMSVDQPTQWEAEMMKKYDMTLEELEERLREQQERKLASEEIESVDSRRIK